MQKGRKRPRARPVSPRQRRRGKRSELSWIKSLRIVNRQINHRNRVHIREWGRAQWIHSGEKPKSKQERARTVLSSPPLPSSNDDFHVTIYSFHLLGYITRLKGMTGFLNQWGREAETPDRAFAYPLFPCSEEINNVER